MAARLLEALLLAEVVAVREALSGLVLMGVMAEHPLAAAVVGVTAAVLLEPTRHLLQAVMAATIKGALAAALAHPGLAQAPQEAAGAEGAVAVERQA